ncbi:Os05g0577050 [Oryza sativa Japonica Group]|uniref:Os05g0577050 protein n=6 Tax=Oryza TaxID=4527 RepID=B9FIH7_ORYSJ|nr:hypothetical protein OsI_21107 [Oryza sativa Indica Group]EEE64798.1 hypothetical protein OsJ_19654 [Oryza sativa Japonica Group]BAS95488.1 Os05g0577050 [Oryza sativa Japonica Group]
MAGTEGRTAQETERTKLGRWWIVQVLHAESAPPSSSFRLTPLGTGIGDERRQQGRGTMGTRGNEEFVQTPEEKRAAAAAIGGGGRRRPDEK